MAFVRKKGKSFYLVHNVREEGRVRQVHLACLGNRPRVSDEVLEQVRQAHPQLQIDWEAVRGRAAETFSSPFTDLEGAQQLVRAMRNLHLDLEELNLGMLRQRLQERAAPEQVTLVLRELMQEMEMLRGQLDSKLKQPPASEPAELGAEPSQNSGD